MLVNVINYIIDDIKVMLLNLYIYEEWLNGLLVIFKNVKVIIRNIVFM